MRWVSGINHAMTWIMSWKIRYVKPESSVSFTLEHDSEHQFISCDSKLFYIFLITGNIIVLSSTEDFDSDKWWKISNCLNVVSGYLVIVGAIYIYHSKVVVFLSSLPGGYLQCSSVCMYRLAFMHWNIIPDTAARSWFISYTFISYIVRLLLVCSSPMFISQTCENSDERGRIDSNSPRVVFV